MSEHPVKSEIRESGDLVRDAAELRREILESRSQMIRLDYPPGRKILYLVCVVAALACTFLVLGSSSIRRSVVTAMALRLEGNPDASAEVFPLPAPPPKPPRVNVETPAYAGSTEGFTGVLFADAASTPAAVTGEEAPGATEQKFVPPPKSPEAAEAFAFLKAKSEVAAAVVNGGRDGFKFKDWMPRKAEPPVFWIDLVAERTSDGEEVHLIWQVNTDAGVVQPLSQEARDLTH